MQIPDKPTQGQAEAANEKLVELLQGFPFAEDPSPGLNLAVALAGLVGAVLRPTLPAAPLIGVSAPAAGSGKSYLVDVISVIATGRRAIGIATGSKPEEFEKALGSALMEGRSLLCLDNMEAPLSGQLLCMALTAPAVSVRVLGRSQMIDAPTGTALFATGNNLAVKGDMARRALLCQLDAGVEHPEDREFEHDLLEEARRRRSELLSAVLTIARWHHCEGYPAPRSARRFAGFEAWCKRVRDPLLALGHVDAVGALDVTREADLEGARLVALAGEWADRFQNRPITAPDVIKRAEEDADNQLMSALLAVTASRPGAVSAAKLSNYLRRFEGRIVQGRRFRRVGTRAKVVEWALQEVGS